MKHALLGPSGAKRWMSCTPSPRFEEQFPDKDSEFAQEGTSAHEYLELLTNCIIGGNDGADVAAAQAFPEQNPHYNGEMEEAVGLYLDIMNEKYAELYKLDPASIIMAEQRVDFSAWVPEGFGTADTTLIGAGIIEVIDLKYGKGVHVEAEANPQLRLYGLGAWNAAKALFDIHTVRYTIVQPRLGSVTTDEIHIDDLLKWANEEVKPKAELAWQGLGEFIPGDHCKFCKAKPRCKALADHNMELAKLDFVLPGTLTNEQIADILGRIDRLTDWANTVKEYALYEAENNNAKWPGWKLVEGRSNRKITDTDTAINLLKEEGINEAMLYKPREVLGITALESLVGKKKFATVLDGLIEKPPGKPTLVKETDKRPELNSAASAAADFS